MLRELRVRDLAVIADVTLTLKPGLNVLTGETGAGKSILVDALSLLLGERASSDRVRPGARQAVIEAAFDVDGVAGFQAAAEASGLEIDDGQFVVRRTLSLEGRNRVWANGSPTTVGVLAALGRQLVDLHGQHEAQSLLEPGVQRDILDAFGNAVDACRAVREAHERLQTLRDDENRLVKRRDDIRRRSDYLSHVVEEIADVAPVVGEDETLAADARRLSHADDLVRLASQLAEILDGEGTDTLTHGLAEAERTIEQLERIDPDRGRWRELIETAVAAVDELGREVRSYESTVDIDPGRLEDIESRRDRIYRLCQKYGGTVVGVLDTQRRSGEELDLLDSAEFDLDRIREERAITEGELGVRANRLSELRGDAADRLSTVVDGLLPALGLPDGRFLPRLIPIKEPNAYGFETVSFDVQLNPGLDARPLAQVASGGELSRLMLALKVVLAEHDAVPTLVFDEVDQGIGGETGARVAEALRKVAENRQTFVITHLAQIAAQANHHLKVDKRADRGVATARVSALDPDERVSELARMLGDATDQTLLQHARDLIAGRSSGMPLGSPAI